MLGADCKGCGEGQESV